MARLNKNSTSSRSRWTLGSPYTLLLFSSVVFVSLLVAQSLLLNGGESNSGAKEPTNQDKDVTSDKRRSLRTDMDPFLHNDLNDFFFSSPFFDIDPFFHNHLRSASLLVPTTFGKHTPTTFFERVNSFLSATPHGYEIVESDKNTFQIKMDLPGLKSSDINIEVVENGSVLRIHGSRKETDKDDNVVSEAHFEKRFTVKENFEVDKITARFVDGVLTVVIPKKKEKPVVKIPITTGERTPRLVDGMENTMLEQL